MNKNTKENARLKLPQVTLAAMSSVDIPETVRALQYSMRGIEFGDVVLITDKKPAFLPKEIRYSHTGRLSTIDDYNYKMVYEFGQHIHTDFVLQIHADGFIVHPELWRDEFLDYDYIGAPWPVPAASDTVSYRDADGNLIRVGNSVGIRSKRLLDYPARAGLEWTGYTTVNGDYEYNEDIYLCCTRRRELEAAGFTFAPLDVAKYFSREHPVPENEGITPFLFHKWYGENASFPNYLKKPAPVVFMRRVKKKLGRIFS